jgi:hypothetical protein
MLETLKDTRDAVIEATEPLPNKDQNVPQSKARERLVASERAVREK